MHTAPMIGTELAGLLKDAGLVWHPAAGDRFTLVTGTFDGEVFTVSDMVVEARPSQTGTILGFNGTTEWALDSAELSDALWLPREDQLRQLLGSSFLALERVGSRVGSRVNERVGEGYLVRSRAPGGDPDAEPATYWGQEPAEAYGRALLDLIRAVTS